MDCKTSTRAPTPFRAWKIQKRHKQDGELSATLFLCKWQWMQTPPSLCLCGVFFNRFYLFPLSLQFGCWSHKKAYTELAAGTGEAKQLLNSNAHESVNMLLL